MNVAGLLTCVLLLAFPSLYEDSGKKITTSWIAYSCGYSSGIDFLHRIFRKFSIAPDSLLILRKVRTKIRCKGNFISWKFPRNNLFIFFRQAKPEPNKPYQKMKYNNSTNDIKKTIRISHNIIFSKNKLQKVSFS